MAYSIPSQFGGSYTPYDEEALSGLLASKGGKLLPPDAFYTHPAARKMFGSYSTYVDWYAGGKARKQQESDMYSKASSGAWTPTDYGPITAGNVSGVRAGGRAISGIEGRDITGQSTIKAPGGEGMMQVPYDYRQAERVDREKKRRFDLQKSSYDRGEAVADMPAQAAQKDYDRQVAAAKREAYTPEQAVQFEKDVVAQQRVALREAKETAVALRFKTGWVNRNKADALKFTNSIDKMEQKSELDEARSMRVRKYDTEQRNIAAGVSQTYRKEILDYAASNRLAEYKTKKDQELADAKSTSTRKRLEGLIDSIVKMQVVESLKQQDMTAVDARLDALRSELGAVNDAPPIESPVQPPPTAEPAAEQTFNSTEEAEAADLQIGDIVVINGQRYVWE